ncbi:MAG: hypothetical protein IT423_03475, partial [Pirellulaceae bacterium]|nr:hypothetical protein [Pirellulaceae bacterium]
MSRRQVRPRRPLKDYCKQFLRRKLRARTKPHLKFESLEDRRVLATEFARVTSFAPQDVGPEARNLTSTGANIYFTGQSPTRGEEVWILETFGPRVLSDVAPGIDGSAPRNLTNVGGSLYFVATNSDKGDEIYRATGGNTVAIAEVIPGPQGSSATNLTNANGDLAFTANDGTRGMELWRWNGFAMTMVRDIVLGSGSSNPRNLLPIANLLFFTANDGVNGEELWMSDGSTNGTFMVRDLRPGAASSNPSNLTNVDGILYFTADVDGSGGSELYRLDNLFAPPTAIAATALGTNSNPRNLVSDRNALYFTATLPATGEELWMTDRFLNSATMVADIFPGASSSNPANIKFFNGQLVFTASDSTNNLELWRSNVFTNFVEPLTNLSTSTLAADIQQLTPVGPNLMFVVNGSRLWRSSGIASGTNLLTNFTDVISPTLRHLVAHGGNLFFVTAGTGGDVWRSNTVSPIAQNFTQDVIGSDDETIKHFQVFKNNIYMVSDGSSLIEFSPYSMQGSANDYFQTPDVDNLTVVGTTMYFTVSGNLMKMTDGFSSVSTVKFFPFGNVQPPRSLMNVNGTLFFVVYDPAVGNELWKSDGTEAGTVRVADIAPGPSSSSIDNLINIGSVLYFTANDGINGVELWKSDGTTAGTTMVRNIATGAVSADPKALTNVGGVLYFAANDGSSGTELWRSDGTAAGTVLVRDIFPGTASSNPSNLLNVNNTLYFAAVHNMLGNELWRSDGTSSGTTLVSDINEGSGSSNPQHLTNVSGVVFFIANNGFTGPELWKSDGTVLGTRQVRDIRAGSIGSAAHSLTNINGRLFFVAKDNPEFSQLWSSDGFSFGTVPVTNTIGSRTPDISSGIYEAFGKIFFLGRDDQWGAEPFALGRADYGDALKNTTAQDSGAWHFDNGAMLGLTRDSTEPDGQTSATANGDDLHGTDDEDGITQPLAAIGGETMTFNVVVSNATTNTRLAVWFDWNLDGDYQDSGEQMLSDRAVVNGNNSITLQVPNVNAQGTSFARFRVSEAAMVMYFTGYHNGEVEDHPFTLTRSSIVTLPDTSANDIVVRRSGANVQVVNRTNSNVLFSDAISAITQLRIVGSNTQTDTVLVDYAAGGFFAFPSGIDFAGQGGSDSLTVTGNGNGQAIHSVITGPVTKSEVRLTESAVSNSVTYTDVETLVFNGLQSFFAVGTFDIGNRSITIGATNPVNLASTNTISGGSLTAGAIALGGAATLTGFGTIAANFSGQVGSVITLNGTLTIGNAGSASGFLTLGSIVTGVNTFNLLDADAATLGPSTTVGTASAAGRIVANGGLAINSGAQVSGFGTLETPNNPSLPIINHGSIIGATTSNRLTLPGFVMGTGTLNRTQITGTHNPGSPLAAVSHGEVVYAGTLIMDLGGVAAGTGFDRINHNGLATLGGVLDVRQINGFVADTSHQFALFHSTGGLTGRFATVLLPTPPANHQWELDYSSTEVNLKLLAVSLTIVGGVISENGGVAFAVLTRNDVNLSQSLTVNVSSNDTTEATVPATVVMPAGQRQVNFVITAVDDQLLDGDQIVGITVSANGYGSDTRTVTVTDFESLSLTINPGVMSENGGSVVGTVSRSNTDVSVPITISLSSSDTTEATVPATVTILAGQTSADFTIQAVDDNLMDGTQTATITASSLGYNGTSRTVDVTDSESLSITIDQSTISENGGVTQARVTRSNTNNGTPLLVNLQSSDLSEATVPATITIPAGQAFAIFTITAVDDLLLDGPQVVTISGSAISYVTGTQTLTVTDAESLQVTINVPAISESGGTAIGTVTRSNTDVGAAIQVQLASNDLTEATVPATVTIPAGQASTTFTITAVDDALLDGKQTVTISASATGYASGTRTVDVLDSENLTLSIAPGSISENGGSATGTVSRSNTDITLPLVVQVGSSDSTEANVPSVVIIPANQASTVFTISAVDDSLLDGTQSVVITVSASGYAIDNKPLDVIDHETLQVTINPPVISEVGGVATGTVTRSNTNTFAPVTVTLSSSDTTEATVPATVVIPAGVSSVTFAITAIDDLVQDGTQTAIISATASGYVGGSQAIDIMDSVSLTLTINPGSIGENAGSAVATVTRSNSNTSTPLTVSLTSSDTTEATVPATVTIPANQSSVNFVINAVDDDILDGSQSIVITAAAVGYLSAVKNLTVLDHELLRVTLDAASISELGGLTTGRVSRLNTNITQAITVLLTSSDMSEAIVPASVIIAANQTSATFTITAVDDLLLDGTQSSLISVASAGYVSDSTSISVLDSETLSLSIAPATISENGGSAVGTLTRSNTDNSLPLTVVVVSNDTTEASVPATVTIPANQASTTFAITANDDNMLDGPQTVAISVSAAGYVGDSRSVSVTDHETLSLSIDTVTISENGGSTVATITRSNTDTALALTVLLTNSDSSEISIPVSVTIPANQASATFTVAAVDDTLLDGLQKATINATATGYVGSTINVSISDSESLSLLVTPSIMSENGGSGLATLTRSNSDIALPLTVAIQSSDTTEANVPASVTIPANQASVTFSVVAVDDSLLDGLQNVTISAAAAGYEGVTKSISILDSESLSLSIAPATISENGGSAVGTLSRSNTDNSLPLTVVLVSSDTSEASVPATVTIPANQASTTFVITANDDNLLDGSQLVAISGIAAGYAD